MRFLEAARVALLESELADLRQAKAITFISSVSGRAEMDCSHPSPVAKIATIARRKSIILSSF